MKFKLRLVLAAILSSIIFCYILFVNSNLFRPTNFNDSDNDYVDFSRETEVPSENKEVPAFVDSNKTFLSSEADEATVEIMVRKFLKLYSVDLNYFSDTHSNIWNVASDWVKLQEIHPEFTPEMGHILSAMSRKQITKADVGHRGTQLKLTLTLDGGQLVVFKPQWYERDFVVEGLPYDGHDRHNAEIAAFHLSRILGYRRVPLTVGRRLDLVKDIQPVATERLLKTFFTNDSDVCFYGKCLYCKGETNGVCAKGTSMEGAVVLWLPKRFKFQLYRHPWGRTYKAGKPAKWEYDGEQGRIYCGANGAAAPGPHQFHTIGGLYHIGNIIDLFRIVDFFENVAINRQTWEYDDEHYCADVEKLSMYSSGRLLLDMMDACVFDYIIGNADRHHFEVFQNETNNMLIMFDNAKSFGNPFHDEESILAPLNQCKKIRLTTVQRLNQLKGGVLVRVLRAILDGDPLAPLLTEAHYRAIQRRLDYLIKTFAIRDIRFVHPSDEKINSLNMKESAS